MECESGAVGLSDAQRKLVAATADRLLTNHFRERGVRLAIIDGAGRDLGGWGRPALQLILGDLAAAIRVSREQGEPNEKA